MALTYTRLTDIFSDQYLHEQAIFFSKLSLAYYKQYDSNSWHISRMLKEIGIHYDIMERWDSAMYYYTEAVNILSDTNNLLYRDIATVQAFITYKTENNTETSLNRLKYLSTLSEGNKEYYSRYAIIGEIYYHEKIYDSAWKYLYPVFLESPSVASRKQSAELLADICKVQGGNPELIEFAEFLIPFANQKENGSTLYNQLTVLYDAFLQNKSEQQHHRTIRKGSIISLMTVSGLVIIIVAIIVLYKRSNYAHKMQQAALSGRLKRSNEALRNSMGTIKNQNAEQDARKNFVCHSSKEKYSVLLQTPICQDISTRVDKLHSDKSRPIKTDADVSEYKSFSLSMAQQAELLKAVDDSFPDLFASLKSLYPSLNRIEALYCALVLMELQGMDLCVFLQKSYPNCRRIKLRLEKNFGCPDHLAIFLMGKAGIC